MRDVHGSPRAWAVGLLAMLVIAGDMFTWMVFGVSCAIGQNSPDAWLDFCDGPFVALPAWGAGLVAFGAVVTWRIGRWWPVVVAAGVGAAGALALWALMGDPAGNFGGLLT